jgi:hypothetical protein
MKIGEQPTQLAEPLTPDSRTNRAIVDEIVFMEKVVVVSLSDIFAEFVDEKNSMDRSPENEIVELAPVCSGALCRMAGRSKRFNIAVGMCGDGLAHESVPCSRRVPVEVTLGGVF